MDWRTNLEYVLVDLVAVPHHLERVLQLEELLLHTEILCLFLPAVTHSPILKVT